jgi:uncharacterized membrane protein
MTDATTPTERARDLDRFLTFVDAVVAIAITLLVLPLVDVAGELHDGSVATLVREHKTDLWAFGLSFAVIAELWSSQHRVLRDVVRSDDVVQRLMLLWVLLIVALPFPTALLAHANEQAAAKLLYVGCIICCSAAMAAVSWHVARTPALRDGDELPDTLGVVGAIVLLGVALALMLAVPAVGYWPLLLLVATNSVVAVVRARLPARARRTVR